MSENLKTIKELADELGVSKQTIRNKIDKDFREKFVQTIKIKGNNTLVINNAGYSLLKKHCKMILHRLQKHCKMILHRLQKHCKMILHRLN